MDLVRFAIWKFRNVEGVLEGMHPYDVLVTRYVDGLGDVTWLRYDMAAETVSLETEDGKSRMQCGFGELEDTLKRLGMYRPRPMRDRHSCTVAPDK